MEVAGVFHFFLQDSLLQRSIKLASDIESDSMVFVALCEAHVRLKLSHVFLLDKQDKPNFFSENISCATVMTCRHMHLEVNALYPEGFLNIWRKKLYLLV